MVIELIELSRESLLKIIQPILAIEQIYQTGLEMAKAETKVGGLEHCLAYANIAEEEEPDQKSFAVTNDPDDSFCDIVLLRYWAAILDSEGFHSLSGPLLSIGCSYRTILFGNTIDLYLSKWREPYRIISHHSAIENTNVREIIQRLNT
jgi:hypothetical protein